MKCPNVLDTTGMISESLCGRVSSEVCTYPLRLPPLEAHGLEGLEGAAGHAQAALLRLGAGYLPAGGCRAELRIASILRQS